MLILRPLLEQGRQVLGFGASPAYTRNYRPDRDESLGPKPLHKESVRSVVVFRPYAGGVTQDVLDVTS